MAEEPKTEGREIRAIAAPVEIRAAAAGTDGGAMATGYAVLYNTVTNICDIWQEQFAPGAFTASLRSDDVMALHSHDIGRVVGRTGAGTLSLSEDAKGIAFENVLPDTTDGRDLQVSIERRDIPGMSFGFIAIRQEWDESVEPVMRTIFEAQLVEITYTACPQYPETTVGLRSLEGARKERRDHNRQGGSLRIAARRARQAQLERGIH
jgi:uncharacterized protein